MFSLAKKPVRKCGVLGEENCEELLVVKKIDDTASFSDRVHRQHGRADVDRLDASLGSHYRSDSGTTKGVVTHNELLKRDMGVGSEHFQDRGTNAVCSVALVSVNFHDDSFVNKGHVARMVFLWVVRMNRMCHVSRKEETLVYRLEIMFLVKSREGAEDTLGDFDGHVAVSTLGGRRADLFVVEKHDHVDLSVIALFNWELRMLDQSIEGT